MREAFGRYIKPRADIGVNMASFGRHLRAEDLLSFRFAELENVAVSQQQVLKLDAVEPGTVDAAEIIEPADPARAPQLRMALADGEVIDSRDRVTRLAPYGRVARLELEAPAYGQTGRD